MKTKVIRTATIVVLLVVSLTLPVQAGPPGQEPPPGPRGPTDKTLIGQLQQETGGRTRISYHAETGKVRFIGTSPDRPIAQPAVLAAGASPEEAARGFLVTYGQLFGLADQARELALMRSQTVDRGRSFVRFQQVYQGLPVLGGELIVQLDADRDVVSANGEVLPDPELDVTPRLDAAAAQEIARGLVARGYDLNADDLTASEPELWIYNPILLKPGLNVNSLVWRMDVEPREVLPIRELVLVDAHLGAVVLHFNQIDGVRDRETYDANNTTTLPGTLVCDESNPSCTGGDSHEVAAHLYAGDTYDFYNTYHGRDSIDNAGMTLISTVHYGSGYANAFWNGSQMVYGDAYGFPLADDVVAHEMTHGVTSYESHLFYYMQSGAVNEAFSDMWGEFVDLTNGAGDDSAGVRWLMGEDISGLGALRDMSNPPAYGLPDKMTSTLYYCGEGDNGGVHYNMGVGSKAAYLMVDGDTFNSYTVTGIGIDKTAKIWYEVQANRFTSASDYQDLYDALYQACTDLIGTSGITAADCQEVRDATDATEMNQQPTSCPAPHAPICPVGQSPNDLFFDDMESTGSGNWTSAAIVGSNQWYYPQTANPYGFDATYATSGVYNIWGYDQPGTADYYMAMTFDVALPAGSTPYLHFNHAYAFEDSDPTDKYDGGVLEYSTDGGGSWNDAGSLFTHNGYNGTIDTGYSNPLEGRSAFVSESNGYISSRLDLSSLAGQSVRFRFRIGTDYYLFSDALGWFIDDLRIYTCEFVVYSFPYCDDFESGSPDWTSDGLWHVVQDGVSPYPNSYSPTHSWWYGQDATGDYDTGVANSGDLTSPAIDIPAGTSPVVLSFWQWYRTEDDEAMAGTIYFDRYHDTDGDDHIGSGGNYEDLADELNTAGYDVYEYNQPIDFAELSEHTVLALFDPEIALSDSERIAIHAFMSNGGRVILLGEWADVDGANTVLNALSQDYGITFNSDTVYDDTNNDGLPSQPLITNYADHALTQGISTTVLYGGASLSVTVDAIPLASGDGDSYATLSAAGASGAGEEEGPSEGDMTPTVIISGAPVVMAYAQVGSGDLIAIGDSSLWVDTILYYYDNLALALNMVDRDVQHDDPRYDQKLIQVSADGGPFQTVAQVTGGPMGTWLRYWVPMSDYAGSTVRFRFHFDTTDDWYNDYRGWYVDDVCLQGIPDIGVSPTSFEETVYVDEIVTKTLTINNSGEAVLEFLLTEVEGPFTPLEATIGSPKAVPLTPKKKSKAAPDYSGPNSDEASAFPSVASEERILRGGSKVLIIQDQYPWGYDAIQQVLDAYVYGIGYDQVGSSAIPTIDLSPYELVIIPSNQTGGFYTTWNANIAKFEAYVEAGGALWLSTCAFSSISPEPSVPGGVINATDLDDYNDIVEPTHPWVMGVPDPMYGDAASHDSFTNLYPGSLVVAQAQTSGDATLVDYGMDAGRILLTGQTLEYAWSNNWDGASILDNSLLDMFVWAGDNVPWLSEDPISSTVSASSSLPVDVIFDATGLAEGDYTADLVIYSNDPHKNPVTVPVVMHVVKPGIYLPIIPKNY